LGDSRGVWSGLLTLAIVHELYCAAAGGAKNSSVLRLPFDELVEAVCAYCDVEPGICQAVLRELVLDGSLRRDMRAQPLIESNGLVLVAPRACLALAWEACSLLLWSKRHSRAYSRYVTTYKKTLADDFATQFKRFGLQVSVMRRLSERHGEEVGDADVAVYDAEERYLGLFEIKWLQPPEDTFEIITADERLMEGVDQAHAVAEFVRRAPDRAMELLFPRRQDNPAPSEVESFVLCRGATGSEYVSGAVIPIYDYDASVSVVRSRSGSLREICQALVETLERPPGSPELSLVYDRLEICGWDIRVPGYGPPRPFSGGRNDPCSCNSGLKFKRCCGR
jgi:SEC-C motif